MVLLGVALAGTLLQNLLRGPIQHVDCCQGLVSSPARALHLDKSCCWLFELRWVLSWSPSGRMASQAPTVLLLR
jgi:hypothetical protein